MATGNDGEMKVKELIYMKYAADVKKELLEDLDGIFQELSAELFLPLTEVPVGDNAILDTEYLFSKFKKQMRKGVLENFDAMWESAGLSPLVAAIQSIRDAAPDKSCTQWRPTGKTPQEQMRPFIVKSLQRKCQYFDKQIEFQEKMFETTVPQLVNIKENISQIREQRKILLDLIKVHENEVDKENSSVEVDNITSTIRE